MGLHFLGRECAFSHRAPGARCSFLTRKLSCLSAGKCLGLLSTLLLFYEGFAFCCLASCLLIALARLSRDGALMRSFRCGPDTGAAPRLTAISPASFGKWRVGFQLVKSSVDLSEQFARPILVFGNIGVQRFDLPPPSLPNFASIIFWCNTQDIKERGLASHLEPNQLNKV